MPETLRISMTCGADRAAALHALRFATVSLGLRCEEVDEAAGADLHYGVEPREGAAFVPYWPECYRPGEPHVAAPPGEQRFWVPAKRADETPVDIIGGIARLLNFLDEEQVADHDREGGGVFAISALPEPRAAVCTSPLVDWHVAALASSLSAAGIDVSRGEPRWPDGARYAVVLTHDVDAAGLHDPRELLRVSVRALRYRSPRMLIAALSAVTGWLRRRPDPQFQFAEWARMERKLGVRSAFYVHIREGPRRHLHDPTYSVNRDPRWRVLGDLIAGGWEVGVHAAIGSAHSAARIARERVLLSAIVQGPVHGLRHHYWRLDWRAPWRTFRFHAEAGYTYDTSIAWRDHYGFRAGTSHPYKPFDRDSGRTLNIIEIPTTVMDGHVFEYLGLTREGATDALRQLAATVRTAGGVLNLNWHQETFTNRHAHQGWRDVYETIAHELAHDTDAWVTTPQQVAQWWMGRLERLDSVEPPNREETEIDALDNRHT